MLDSWLAAEGLTDLRALTGVRACWREVVGNDVARHATPRSFHAGVLVVAVDHSSWATELRFLEGRIREGLASQLGAGVVTRLEARVDAAFGVE